MIVDASAKDVEVDYNYLNLPQRIDHYSDFNISPYSEHYYDATGRKLVKYHNSDNTPPTTTYYLNGLHLDAGKSFDFTRRRKAGSQNWRNPLVPTIFGGEGQ